MANQAANYYNYVGAKKSSSNQKSACFPINNYVNTVAMNDPSVGRDERDEDLNETI